MRVTAVQTNPGTDMDANLDDIRRLVGDAVTQDRPDFVLLPEVMAFMGGNAEDRRATAEELPGGRVYTALSEIAREHGALSLEMRASVSLARLRKTQSREPEIRPLLEDVYRRFTEGHGTPTLEEAEALLAEAGSSAVLQRRPRPTGE